ncbi:hypothetical protein O3M35_003242 [Rhynocoris fuscipes]|uniref:NADH dehydrogenase subunit 6 n=1 Tax=Rhynocoris fuscipes TaxID=488301 RepID=A0AAW1CJG9_9HEMI
MINMIIVMENFMFQLMIMVKNMIATILIIMTIMVTIHGKLVTIHGRLITILGRLVTIHGRAVTFHTGMAVTIILLMIMAINLHILQDMDIIINNHCIP